MRLIGAYRIAVIVLLLIVIAQGGAILHLMQKLDRAAAPGRETVSARTVWRAGGSAAEAGAATVPAAQPEAAPSQMELVAHVLRAADMPWATSADGKLALRVSSDSSTYSRGHVVKLLIELRNASGAPIWTAAPNVAASDVKIDSGGGIVPYVGAVASPSPMQLVWLQAGETVRSIVELRTDHFTGFDNTASYRLRCRYACDSSVKSQKAEAWVGAIDSVAVEIQRQ